MAAVGTLVVQLAADVAQLRKDLDKATSITRQTATSMEKSFKDIKNAVIGAFGLHEIKQFALGVIEAAKQAEQASNRMSAVLKATGNAVGLTKGQIDALADSLAESTQFDDESIRNAASQFIKFGNIQQEVFTKGIKLSADLAAFMGTEVPDAAQMIGKALSEPEEGLGRLARQVGKLTDEQQHLIDEFTKTGNVAEAQKIILEALESKIGGTAEALNKGLTKATSDAAKAWDEFREALGKTSAVQVPVTHTLNAITESLKDLQAVIDSDSFTEFYKRWMEFVAGSLPVPLLFKGMQNQMVGEFRKNRPNKPSGIPDEEIFEAEGLAERDRQERELRAELSLGRKNLKAVQDTAFQQMYDGMKRNLDQRLKLLDNAIDREKDLESTRNKFLDFYYNENQLSISQYYAARNNVIQENLQKTLKYYDAEIGALKKFASTALQADAINAQTKINDLVEKKRKLETEAATATVMSRLEETKATQDYLNSLKNLEAQLEQMKGNFGASAGMQFDLSNADLRKRLEAERNQTGIDKLESVRKFTVAQADLNKLTEEASILQDQLSNKEARIDIDRKLGAKSELDSLVAISQARRKSVVELQAIADNMKRIAEESDNKRLIQNAENFRVQVEELAASANLLRDRFSNMFESSFADFFEKVATGTESLKDAFKSMVNDINRQLLRLAVEDVAGKIFKGASGGSGGGILSGIGDFLGGIFGGARAMGGATQAGKLYLVGENGPELWGAGMSGTVIPNNAIGGNVNVTVNVPQGTNMSRASLEQTFADIGTKISRAVRRNT